MLKVIRSYSDTDDSEIESILNFLYTHLEEYGDPKDDIQKAIDYSLQRRKSFGGYIIVKKEDEKVLGAVILNKTGMDGYIPENILVYIATHKDARGKGLGRELMEKAIEITEGGIALHVEPDNPARFLYEKVGFNSKYKEMRYQR
ncbi:MAG: GNAT family N-acetyltransferase [Hyphomicrobiales bacterium]